jgi:hypothetical protein
MIRELSATAAMAPELISRRNALRPGAVVITVNLTLGGYFKLKVSCHEIASWVASSLGAPGSDDEALISPESCTRPPNTIIHKLSRLPAPVGADPENTPPQVRDLEI